MGKETIVIDGASKRGVLVEDSAPCSALRIVIVNWNSGEQLRQCLESIGQAEMTNCVASVVVVDNASTDNSLVSLPEVRVPVTVIRNDVNRGFAAACNQGALGCGAQLVLFLNPDTRILSDSIRVGVQYMQDVGNGKVA